MYDVDNHALHVAGDEASVEAENIHWQQLWGLTELSKRPNTVVGAAFLTIACTRTVIGFLHTAVVT